MVYQRLKRFNYKLSIYVQKTDFETAYNTKKGVKGWIVWRVLFWCKFFFTNSPTCNAHLDYNEISFILF